MRLVPATGAAFAWLLDGGPAPEGLRLPPGGVADAETLEMLARSEATTRSQGVAGTFLVEEEGEVVGICGVKAPPDRQGCAEIGYGIAASRRDRHFATRAIAMLLERLPGLGVREAMALIAPGNTASEQVLERNGFVAGPRGAAMGGARMWRRRVRGRRGRAHLPPPPAGSITAATDQGDAP